jgi:hypothetical protein
VEGKLTRDVVQVVVKQINNQHVLVIRVATQVVTNIALVVAVSRDYGPSKITGRCFRGNFETYLHPAVMPAQQCGYCYKQFSKAKDVQLHIGNSAQCRAARNRDRSRRHDEALASLSPEAHIIEPIKVSEEEMDSQPCDDQPDYEPTHRWTKPDPHKPLEVEQQLGETSSDGGDRGAGTGRYAEDFDPENVAHTFGKA